MMLMGRLFITNALQRKSLSVTRSMGRQGHDITTLETTSWNPTSFSKYSNRFVKTLDPSKDPEQFYDMLKARITLQGCDVLYPMDDDTMKIVIEHQEELEKICHFTVPSKESFQKALYKDLAVQTAMSQDVRCPATVFPKQDEDLVQSVSHLDFPILIRAVNQSGSRGMRVVNHIDETEKVYREMCACYPRVIIQEYIEPSRKIDVCLLYNREGRLCASFVQEELRNYPPVTGPSTVQESIVHDAALESAVLIMDSLHWTGIAEVEFILDRTGEKLYFMEINPRFWSSLELSVLAGVDFPKLYYEVSVTGDCEKVTTYRTGVKTRWFFPGDLMAFLSAKEKLSMNPPFFFAGRAGLRDDTIRFSDPFPILGLFLATVYYLMNRNRRRTFLKR
jgi:predicted ATP-grasp superfamily ATP-dependent carboligase